LRGLPRCLPPSRQTENTDTRTRTTVEILPCRLTPDELLIAGKDASKLVHDMATLEEEKKEKMQEYAARLKGMQNQHSLLSNKVRTETEYRDVECTVTYDYSNGWAITSRIDTGEITDRRPLRAHERQTTMEV
jgi:hypothetical protein